MSDNRMIRKFIEMQGNSVINKFMAQTNKTLVDNKSTMKTVHGLPDLGIHLQMGMRSVLM